MQERTVEISVTGCHIWMGALNSAGYGNIYYKNKWWLAHRLVWMQFNGEIPKGLQVQHICGVKCCVNPNHLKVGTQSDNERDKIAHGRFNWQPWSEAGRAAALVNKRTQTHCKRGHEYTCENTYVNRKDQRSCKTCARKLQRARARNR